MTFLRRFVLLSFCTLLLAACEVRSFLDIDMSDVSNGTVSVQVGFDQQFRDAIDELGGGADLLGELETDAPNEGWAVDRFEDGDIEGVTLTKPFSSVEELQTILEEGRISGPQEGLIGAVTLTDTGNTIRFEADVPEGGGLGEDFEGFDPGQMDGLLTYDARIRVTFPGEVIDHNGELEDNTVTWNFDDPSSMAGAQLFAEANKGSGSLWVGLIGIGLGLGVVALVVWQILSRRQPPAEGLIASRLDHHPEPVPTSVAVEPPGPDPVPAGFAGEPPEAETSGRESNEPV